MSNKMQQLHLNFNFGPISSATGESECNFENENMDTKNIQFWLKHLLSLQVDNLPTRNCCLDRLLQNKSFDIREQKSIEENELAVKHLNCNDLDKPSFNNNETDVENKDHWCVKIPMKQFTVKQVHVAFCSSFSSICVVGRRMDTDGLHVELHKIPIPAHVDSETIKVHFTEDRILVINGEFYKDVNTTIGNKRISKKSFDDEFELISNSSDVSSESSLQTKEQLSLWCSEDCTPIEHYLNVNEVFYPREQWGMLTPQMRQLEFELKNKIFKHQEEQNSNKKQNSDKKDKEQQPRTFLGQINFRIVKAIENFLHEAKELVWPDANQNQQTSSTDKKVENLKKTVYLEIYINLENFSAKNISIEQVQKHELVIKAGVQKCDESKNNYGFSKSVFQKLELPTLVDLSNVKANLMTNGILRIRAPIDMKKLTSNIHEHSGYYNTNFTDESILRTCYDDVTVKRLH